jgi:hypothetical protein
MSRKTRSSAIFASQGVGADVEARQDFVSVDETLKVERTLDSGSGATK